MTFAYSAVSKVDVFCTYATTDAGRQGLSISEHVTPNYERLVNLCFPAIVHQPAVNSPMAQLSPSIAQCAVVATALKVLLFPA